MGSDHVAIDAGPFSSTNMLPRSSLCGRAQYGHSPLKSLVSSPVD